MLFFSRHCPQNILLKKDYYSSFLTSSSSSSRSYSISINSYSKKNDIYYNTSPSMTLSSLSIPIYSSLLTNHKCTYNTSTTTYSQLKRPFQQQYDKYHFCTVNQQQQHINSNNNLNKISSSLSIDEYGIKKTPPIRPIDSNLYNEPVDSIYDEMTKLEFEKHLSQKFNVGGLDTKKLLKEIQSDRMYQTPTVLYNIYKWLVKLQSFKTIEIFNYILTFIRQNTIQKSGLFEDMAGVLMSDKYAPIVKVETINIILGYFNDIKDHSSAHRCVFMLTQRKRLVFNTDTYIEMIRLHQNDLKQIEGLARKIKSRSVKRTDVLDAHLIRAFILNGDVKSAIDIYNTMEEKPTAIVFDALLVSVVSINRFDLFDKYWEEMENLSIEPLPQTIALAVMKHGQFLDTNQFNQFYNLIQEKYTKLVTHPEVLSSFIHTLAYGSQSYDYIEMFLNRLQDLDLGTPELCCNVLSIVVSHCHPSIVEQCCNDIYNRIFKLNFNNNLNRIINRQQQQQQQSITNTTTTTTGDQNIFNNNQNMTAKNSNGGNDELDIKLPTTIFERLIWASISLNNIDMVRKWWTAMMHQIWPARIKPPKIIYSMLMRYYLTRGTKRELDTLIRTLLIFDMGVTLDQAIGQDQIPNTKELRATGQENYEQIADTIVYFEIYVEEQHRWGTQLYRSYVDQLQLLKTNHSIRQAYNRIIHTYLLIGRLEDAKRWFDKFKIHHSPTASTYLWFITYHTFRRQGRLAAEWEEKLQKSGYGDINEEQRNNIYNYYRKYCHFSLAKPMSSALHTAPYFI